MSIRERRIMKRKLKVKFSLIVPCEKEIVIHDEKEFNDNKESFLLLVVTKTIVNYYYQII